MHSVSTPTSVTSELHPNPDRSPDHLHHQALALRTVTQLQRKMAFTLATAAQLPLASGTLPNCHLYLDHSAWPTPAIIDQRYKSRITEQAQNDCRWVARRYGVDFDDLLQWNPSLSVDDKNCHFQPGYSYCVSKTNESKNREQVASDRATICLSKGALESAEVVDRTDPECECFGRVTGQEMMDNNRKAFASGPQIYSSSD